MVCILLTRINEHGHQIVDDLHYDLPTVGHFDEDREEAVLPCFVKILLQWQWPQFVGAYSIVLKTLRKAMHKRPIENFIAINIFE